GSMSTQREHDDAAVVDAFAEHLRLERGRSEHTVSAYRREAAALLEHLRRTERIALEELDVTALRSWLGVRADSGAGASTLARTFTTSLAATGRMPHDGGGRLRAPRRGRHLPTVLSGDQAGALLDGMGERADGGPRSPAPRFAASRDPAPQEGGTEHPGSAVDGEPEPQDPIARAVLLRDIAVLELLYSSGLRVSELVALDRPGIDHRHRTVRVRGKGDRERIVPVG